MENLTESDVCIPLTLNLITNCLLLLWRLALSRDEVSPSPAGRRLRNHERRRRRCETAEQIVCS